MTTSYNEYMIKHPDESGLIHELHKVGVFKDFTDEELTDLELNYQLKYGDLILQAPIESLLSNLITPLEKLAKMINLHYGKKWESLLSIDPLTYNGVTETTKGNINNVNKISAYDSDDLIDDSGNDSTQDFTKTTSYNNISNFRTNVDFLTKYDTMLLDIKNYLSKNVQQKGNFIDESYSN